MAGEVIKEFLVALGVKVDTQAFRNIDATVRGVAKSVSILATELKKLGSMIVGPEAAKHIREITSAIKELGQTVAGATGVRRLARSLGALARAAGRTVQGLMQAASAAAGVVGAIVRAGTAIFGVLRVVGAVVGGLIKGVGEVLGAVLKVAAALGGALIAASVSIVYAIERIGRSMFELTNTAQTLGTTVTQLMAMRSAAQAVGIDMSALEGMAKSLSATLRTSPQMAGLLQSWFGVKPGTDPLQAVQAIVRRYREALDSGNKALLRGTIARAEQLGLPEQALFEISQREEAFEQETAKHLAMLEKWGIKNEDLIRKSKEWQEAQTTFWSLMEVISVRVGTVLMPVVSNALRQLTDYINAHSKEINTWLIDKLEKFVGWLKSVDWEAIGGWLTSSETIAKLKEFGQALLTIADALARMVLLFKELPSLIPGHEGFKVQQNDDPKESWLWGKVKQGWNYVTGGGSAAASTRGDIAIPGASRGETGVLNQVARGESSEFKEAWNKFHADGSVVRTLADVEAKEGKSHAFGIYGFQPGTYREMAKIAGFDPNDISAMNQNLAALTLLRKEGANASRSWAASAVHQPGGRYPSPKEWEEAHPGPQARGPARGPDPNVWPFPSLPHSGGQMPTTPPTAGAPPGTLGAVSGPAMPQLASSRSVHAPISQQVTVNAHGANSEDVGRAVRLAMDRSNADMLRDMRSAFVEGA